MTMPETRSNIEMSTYIDNPNRKVKQLRYDRGVGEEGGDFPLDHASGQGGNRD